MQENGDKHGEMRGAVIFFMEEEFSSEMNENGWNISSEFWGKEQKLSKCLKLYGNCMFKIVLGRGELMVFNSAGLDLYVYSGWGSQAAKRVNAFA